MLVSDQKITKVNEMKKLVLVLVLALFIQACSKTELEPLAGDAVILAFGDSLTAGVGTQKQNSYPAVLAQLAAREVINAGVSGEETDEGRERLQKVLNERPVDLLILLEGGNDILRNRPLDQTKRNLAAMIEMAQARNISVVLLGVPEKKLFSSVAPIYKELADEYSLVFVPDLISDLLREPSLKSDAVHLNTEGYKALAEHLHETLKEHGAL